MPSARTAILGSVAVIATGVGVILLVRRLQRPALEKIAGGKKKRKPSLTRAKSVLRESRRKSDEPTEYAAFVSHMKAEAAMEARFLQIELESQTGEHVFLDSDDLRNLDKLVDHVKAARVLILVQTKSVLTRPYCLLELCVCGARANVAQRGAWPAARAAAAQAVRAARTGLDPSRR